MKINILSGSLSFEGGEIHRSQSRTHFLETMLGRNSKEDLVNEGWRHYRIEPEAGIVGTLFFNGESLDRVFLLMEIPGDKRKDWSEQLELERKATHDSWLRTELGIPPYNYSWGIVTSDFDPRGCVSEIIVTYAE